MFDFIEYLLFFVVISLVTITNKLSIVYLSLSVSILLVSIGIRLYKNKKYGKESKKYKFDINFYLLMSLIIVLDSIYKLEYINLVFGGIYLSLFVLNLIKFVIKKDNIWDKYPIKITQLFDIYILLYLSALIGDVISLKF